LTADDHNKLVAYAQLGHGTLHLLSLIFVYGVMGIMFARIFDRAQSMGNDFPPELIGVILVFAGIINFLLTIPSFVAAYGLLKRRPWAKIAGIIAAVLAAISFPIGTAVAVYTFWFLFSDVGKSIYDRSINSPPPPPVDYV
jgi:hypothetical protein